MILDKDGRPFPEKPIGQRHFEVLERSRRDTKMTLTAHMLLG